MPRRLSFFLFTGVILAALLSGGVMAGASPRDVDDKRVEVASAQERLEEIRQEAGGAYESYNSALYQLNEVDGKISATEEDLASAEARAVDARAELEERASQVYRSGNVGFVDVLVGADSFAEFSTRMNIWLRVLTEEQAQFAEMQAAEAELADQRERLQTVRAERVSALDQASEQRDIASGAEDEAQAYLDSLSTELQDEIAAEEARQAEQARQAAEEAASASEAQAAADLQDQIEEQLRSEALAEQRRAAEEAQQRAEDLAAEQAAAIEAAEAAEELAARAAEQEAADAAERRAAAREARAAADQAAVEQAAAEQAAAEQAAAEQAAAAKAARQAQEDAAAQQAAIDAAAADEAAQQQAAADQAAADQAAADAAAAQAAAEDQAAADLAAQQAAAAQQAQEDAAAEQAAIDAAAAQAAADQAAADQAAADEAAAQPTAGGGQMGGGTASGGGGQAAPVSGGSANGGSIVAAAQAQMGVPYVYGGADPSGFDCSGLVMYVMAQFGVSLPHNAAAQYGYGSTGSGAAGDVVFWDSGGGISHNGIATGGGTVIHAPYPGTVVREEGIWNDGLVGYKTMV